MKNRKMKKIFLTGIFIFATVCRTFSASGPVEYFDATELKEGVQIDRKGGIDVKARPSRNSETLIHLPQNTEVCVMKLNGPKIRQYADGEINEDKWCAILLPQSMWSSARQQIGWIEGISNLQWKYRKPGYDTLNTEGWNSETLQSFLMNSVWELIATESSGEKRDDATVKKHSIVCFDNEQIQGIEYEKDRGLISRKDYGSYSCDGGSSIVFSGKGFCPKGRVKIQKADTCISFSADGLNYELRKINPATFDIVDKISEGKQSIFTGDKYFKDDFYLDDGLLKETEVRIDVNGFLKNFFRMYSNDYYTERNIAQYIYFLENECNCMYDTNLLSIAISYGMYVEDEKYEQYWNPYLLDAEKNIGNGKFTYRGIKKMDDWFSEGGVYQSKTKRLLRDSYGTNGKSIAILNGYTLLQALETGPVDIVDGTISVWVKVTLTKDTTDSSGHPVKKETQGWIFGAFLSPAG